MAFFKHQSGNNSVQLTPRAYQLAIFESIMARGNTLVVLPTGLGKTLIALMLIREKMKEGRCLFLTPTKPLAKQHADSVKGILGLDDKSVSLVTGEMAPKKRKEEYEKDVIVSTPQTIKNDIENARFGTNFRLVIFDEAHRAVGDYAYTYVAEKLKDDALFVGLTASPGGRRDRIKEVLDALFIRNIEIRTTLDPDVAPYIQKSMVTWIPIKLSPTLKLIKRELESMSGKYAQRLSAMGFPPPLKSKGLFMKLGERLRNLRHNVKFPALLCYYSLMHLLHMSELLETQGVFALLSYIEKVDKKESKSAKAVLKEPGMAEIRRLAETGEEHPKLRKLVELLKGMSGKKVIVFAQYRDQIRKIEETLNANGISARQFVGKKDGVTRKIQEATIADFREGKFDVLCSSSIGEEGLDIPRVDSVIFYEPIPSEIRSIQRRGRAARLQEGEVIILMTEDTRDEYYYWSSKKKEQKMKEILGAMQRSMRGEKEGRKEAPPMRPRAPLPVPEKAAPQEEEPEKREPKKRHPAGQTKMSDFA